MPTLNETQKKVVSFAVRVATLSAHEVLKDMSLPDIEEELAKMRKKVQRLGWQEDIFKTEVEIESLKTKIQLFEEKRSSMLRAASYKSV